MLHITQRDGFEFVELDTYRDLEKFQKATKRLLDQTRTELKRIRIVFNELNEENMKLKQH